jgi:hypothetical protein
VPLRSPLAGPPGVAANAVKAFLRSSRVAKIAFFVFSIVFVAPAVIAMS